MDIQSAENQNKNKNNQLSFTNSKAVQPPQQTPSSVSYLSLLSSDWDNVDAYDDAHCWDERYENRP